MRAMAEDEAVLLKTGDLLAGKYRIEHLIGRGGMGAVFAANHEILLQRVAVKVLLEGMSGHPEVVTRFLNEARAAARIQSEHVARVMDVGKLDSGMPFIVLEYLEGADLMQLVEQRGALPVDEAVDYVLQALDALASAHAMGVVHRDLKPANLFVVRRPNGMGHVKVLDFGISKMTQPIPGDSGGMTSTKAMLGTPYYMSPEQLRSSRSVDVRTDIWSMGIILHQILTGQLPYTGENFGELFAKILEQDAPSIRILRPDLPPELEQIVLHCLQRKAEHRFSNVAELATALRPFATMRSAASFDRIQQTLPQLLTAPPPGLGTGPGAPPFGMGSGGGSGPRPWPGNPPQGAPGMGSGTAGMGTGPGAPPQQPQPHSAMAAYRTPAPGERPPGTTGGAWGAQSAQDMAPAGAKSGWLGVASAGVLIGLALLAVGVVGTFVFKSKFQSAASASVSATASAPTVATPPVVSTPIAVTAAASSAPTAATTAPITPTSATPTSTAAQATTTATALKPPPPKASATATGKAAFDPLKSGRTQ
jgi:serine/threonine-protein kinase